MKYKKFSNRISIRFVIAVAILTLLVFTAIYLVVYRTVYNHLDEDLNAESLEVHHSIVMLSDQIIFANQGEWLENEHGQIEVNPTFIQVTDSSGNILKKTPNLEDGRLSVINGDTGKIFFNATLSGDRVRQLQMPLKSFSGNRFGYLSIAIPLEDSQLVLVNLRTVLLLLFPLVFLVLFFVSRFIAQNSIKPVRVLTSTAEKITRRNLDERIPLPPNRDELYILTQSINSLLERIKEALERERQFTSDASHELRTPLSVIRGNLELMGRKERDPSYYASKAENSLKEVDRMTQLIDNLLMLARHDGTSTPVNKEKLNLEKLVEQVVQRFEFDIDVKDLKIEIAVDSHLSVRSDRFMFGQIIENIFSNAVKYSFEGGKISILSEQRDGLKTLTITNEGPGIPEGQQKTVFDRFYRADVSRNSGTGGSGLGLAIVKRFSEILGIEITVESKENEGTKFTLLMPDNAL